MTSLGFPENPSEESTLEFAYEPPPLETVLDHAIPNTPAEYKKTLDTSKDLGISFDLAQENKTETDHISRRRSLMKRIHETETLKEEFKRLDFAALAHEDAENLVEVEKTLKPTLGNIAKGLAWALPEATELTYQGVRMMWADMIGSDRIRKDAEKVIRSVQDHISMVTPDFKSETARGLYSGGTSLARMIPAVAASVATRSPGPALTVMGAQVQTEAYGRYRIRGADPLTALAGSGAEMVTEIITEMAPMGFLVNKFGKVGLGDFLTGMLVREIPGEQLATIVQDAVDTAVANPDKSWGEYMAERPAAGYQTLMATIAMSGVMGVPSEIARVSQKARASRFINEAKQAQSAFDNADKLDKEVETSRNSQLRETAPEEYKQFIEKVIGEDENIFLSYDHAKTLFQENPDLEKSLPEEYQDGGDLVISKADYLTYFIKYHDDLRDFIRSDEDGVSMQEAQDWMDQGQEQFDDQAHETLQEGEAAMQEEQSANNVQNQIEADLIKAGQSKDVAKKAAALQTLMYRQLANKRGVTTEEAFDDFKVKVQSGSSVAGQELFQEDGKPIVQQEGPKQKVGPALLQADKTKRGQSQFKKDFVDDPVALDQFGNYEAVITLLEGANLSTYLHETAHVFLEAYNKYALQNEEIASDMRILIKNMVGEYPSSKQDPLEVWNNLSFEERRAGHEKIAVSFEKYLFEGKAPSVEMREMFQTFKAWMISVYRSLKGLNVNLSPEVRSVFDRMIATDEQIREAKALRSYEPMLTEEDMTATQWAEYQKIDRERQTVAEEEHRQRSLKDIQWQKNAELKALREVRKSAREKWNAVNKKIKDAVSAEPVYMAMQFLKQYKLDIEMLQEMYGTNKPRSSPDVVNPEVDTLILAIAKLGGVTREESELQGIDKENWKGGNFRRKPNQQLIGKHVFRKEGKTFDEMAETLRDYGYEVASPNELVEKIEDAIAGTDTHSTAWNPDLTELQEEAQVPWHKLRSGKGGMTAYNGIPPDIAAQYLQFSSGDNLVRSILSAMPYKERVEMLTDQAVLEKHGDITSPEAHQQAAVEAIHNKAHVKFTHTEMTYLAKKTGSKNLIAAAARIQAKRIIAKKRVRDIRPGRYLAAQVRAGNNASKAFQKGDLNSAADHKRAQVLNLHLYKEALKAKQRVERIYKYINKFNVAKTRKNIDRDYMDQIDSFLEATEFKNVSLKDLDRRKSFQEWAAGQPENTVVADESLLVDKKNYKEMTIEELVGLRDSIKNIEHLGRRKEQMYQAHLEKEQRIIAEESVDSLARNSNRTVQEHPTATDKFGWIASAWRNVTAMHRKFASIIREADGNEYGYLSNLFLRGMNTAGANEAEANAFDSRTIADLFETIAGSIKDGGLPFNMLAAKMEIPGTNISMTRENIIMFGMNQGNAGNKQRLQDGGLIEGRRLEDSEVQAILDQITEDEWHFIQGVLDFVATKKEAIREQERRLTGVEPRWIDPTPIETKFGTFPGGYFPAKYDANLSDKSTQYEALADLRQGWLGVHNKASARNSYAKDRADKVKGRPMMLNFNAISQHLAEVNHRLNWEDWLLDSNQMMNRLNPTFRQYYGSEITKQLSDTIKDIAVGDSMPVNWWAKILDHMRIGSTIVGLGWRVTTALIQPAGLAQSFVRVGSTHMMSGMKRYLRNPLEAGKEAELKSVMMRTRAITMQREINEVMNTIRAGEKSAWLKASAFYMIQKMQKTVDVPTWWAAYERGMQDFGAENALNDKQREEIEAKSIAFADQTVKDSQSSGLTSDLAAIQRGHPALKAFTNFYSYFSATYNLNVEVLRTGDYKSAAGLGKMAGDLLVLNTVPVLFSVALTEVLKGECEWEAECMTNKLGREQLTYLLGLTIPTREVTGAAQKFFGMKSFSYEGPPGYQPLADLGPLATQISQMEFDKELFKAANRVAGDWLHYPAGQINATLDGIYAVEEGSAPNPVGALLTGPPR